MTSSVSLALNFYGFVNLYSITNGITTKFVKIYIHEKNLKIIDTK